MKIYVFPEGDAKDPWNFVAPIRLLDPLKALAKMHDLSFCCHSPTLESNLFECDLAIVQRACFRSKRALDQGLELLNKARRAGVQVVYEIDDHLFCPNLPELIADSLVDELDEQAYELTQAHRDILTLADYVTCPTESLAEALGHLNSSAKIRVIPTALDFRHQRWWTSYQREVRSPSHVRIGWSGGSRVGRDLEILLPVLQRVVELYRDVTVVLGGALKYARVFSSIPKRQLTLLDWVEYNQYPKLLSSFDLALIPMQDHAYNRCKSPLKVIDYGAMGVPAICSSVASFSGIRSLGCSPVLVKTDDDWLKCIADFIDLKLHGQIPSKQLIMTTRRRHGVEGKALARYWSLLCEAAGVAPGKMTA
jgi:hypothetical protein